LEAGQRHGASAYAVLATVIVLSKQQPFRCSRGCLSLTNGNGHTNVHGHSDSDSNGFPNYDIHGDSDSYGFPNYDGHTDSYGYGYPNCDVHTDSYGYGFPNYDVHGDSDSYGYPNCDVHSHTDSYGYGYPNCDVHSHGDSDSYGYGYPNCDDCGGNRDPNIHAKRIINTYKHTVNYNIILQYIVADRESDGLRRSAGPDSDRSYEQTGSIRSDS
jgi:hypothetical protein